MNKILKMLSVICLAAVALQAVPGCAKTVKAVRVLRLDEVAVGEIDPGKASDYADSILMFNLYDTLVIPKQGAPGHEPHLAEGWKASSTSYTFTLRNGVKFIDGSLLTAEDVVFSLERMKAMGRGFSYLFVNVERAEAIDHQTVKFTIKIPYAPFIASLVRLPIVSKAMVMAHLGEGEGEMKDWGETWLASNTGGTGAYKIVSHNPQEETVMEKNPDYFLEVPSAAPDIVRLRYGLDPSTVRTLISRGKHDISSQWLPPEVIKALISDDTQLLTETGSGAFYMKMNTTKAPLDDVHCRLALANAFDYAGAIKMVALKDNISQGFPSTGAIPVGMLGSNPVDQVLKRDIEKAKAHLAQCKTKPEDFNLEISWVAEVPLEERFALLMQANFSELGIKSEIKKLPWALFVERVSKPENTPHISEVFVTSYTGDPDALLYAMYHSSVTGTWQSPEYLNDAEVDSLLEDGRSQIEDSARERAYSALNERLMSLAPTIYGFDRQAVFVASNRVNVPTMTRADKAFGLDGMGFTFRLMELKE